MNVVVNKIVLGKDTVVLVLKVQSLMSAGLEALWRFVLAPFKM